MRRRPGYAQSLPVPRAVLIVSAHREHAPLALSAPASYTPPAYDLGGVGGGRRRCRTTNPSASTRACGERPDRVTHHCASGTSAS
ncbi:hypothetical protein ACFWNQ_11905 [Streptomyces virginiae]|uniref:hypothetical protein n=1 Tax=Streptomyces virginiae TaxID=1961 RepID=UPI0036508B1D